MAYKRLPHKYNLADKLIRKINPVNAKFQTERGNIYTNSPFVIPDGEFKNFVINKKRIPYLLAALGTAGVAYKYGPRAVKAIKDKFISKKKNIK